MTTHHIRHIRMMPSHDRRRQLMARTSEYVVRVERDEHYTIERFDEGYTEKDIAKYRAGNYNAWYITLYRACPDHVGLECADYDPIDTSSIGIVLTELDLQGDYTSPYLINDDYVRYIAWNMWQNRKR